MMDDTSSAPPHNTTKDNNKDGGSLVSQPPKSSQLRSFQSIALSSSSSDSEDSFVVPAPSTLNWKRTASSRNRYSAGSSGNSTTNHHPNKPKGGTIQETIASIAATATRATFPIPATTRSSSSSSITTTTTTQNLPPYYNKPDKEETDDDSDGQEDEEEDDREGDDYYRSYPYEDHLDERKLYASWKPSPWMGCRPWWFGNGHPIMAIQPIKHDIETIFPPFRRHIRQSASASGAAAAAAFADERDHRNWQAVQKELDDIFVQQTKERMRHVPNIDMPKILTRNEDLTLYDYQQDGIRWLVHKEVSSPVAIPSFYKQKVARPGLTSKDMSIQYECTLTKRVYETRPQPIRGSILADGTFSFTSWSCPVTFWLYPHHTQRFWVVVDSLYDSTIIRSR